MVDGVIRHIFKKMRSIPKSEVVNSGLMALQQELESRYKTAQREHTKAVEDITELKTEAIKAIRGESKFSSELLSELITQTDAKLAELATVRNEI